MAFRKESKFTHVCPRNCYSACTMISTVKNDRLTHLKGDKNHPFAKGKLCAKGFSYINNNYDSDRLKYPYYQKVKGSGKLQRITWEEAYNILFYEMKQIHNRYGDFRSIGLHQSNGNVGVHRYMTEQFFTHVGATHILNEDNSSIGLDAVLYDNNETKTRTQPDEIKKASLLIIWGANPAVTNIHLVPFILEAKSNGTKVVVIDPVYTQTAKLADSYIQIRPSSDGALANALTKYLLQVEGVDYQALKTSSIDYEQFITLLEEKDTQSYLNACDMTEETLSRLGELLNTSESVMHLVGVGLQQHANGGQNIRAIHALAAFRGDLWKQGGGVLFPQRISHLLDQHMTNNHSHLKNNALSWHDWIETEQQSPPKHSIELLWISGANPLVQKPNYYAIREKLQNTPFIVSVENSVTPTALMANLILPTTSHFEQLDLVCSNWGIALNEKAISPYYDSRSEWRMMNELSQIVTDTWTDYKHLPIYNSETDYLNHFLQNTRVGQAYGIKTIADLEQVGWKKELVLEKANKDMEINNQPFISPKREKVSLSSLSIFSEGKLPTEKYPFWLISPHYPYAFNSQFWPVPLDEFAEPYVHMHNEIAAKLLLSDDEVVKIYNNQGFIYVKVKLTELVAKDTVYIFQGWFSQDDTHVNKLVPATLTDIVGPLTGLSGIAYNDTFVGIEKL